MNYIGKNVFERELFYDGSLVLKYHIEYPRIYGSLNEDALIRFNSYNLSLALNLKNNAENNLYKEAIEAYKYNKENGYPIMVFEVYRNFVVTYDYFNILSLYFDEYTFTGGAHGSTIRSSQTWNLLQGRMLTLASFFPRNPYFMLDILKEINMQIAKEPDIYFDNTCNLVLETFNPKSFYLVPNGIVIYFQQYDIAPYSSGIRTFTVAYS